MPRGEPYTMASTERQGGRRIVNFDRGMYRRFTEQQGRPQRTARGCFAACGKLAGCGASSVEFLSRTTRTLAFVVVFLLGALRSMGPWMLCLADLAATIGLFAAIEHRQLHDAEHLRFEGYKFSRSLDDLVGLSVCRTALVGISYALALLPSIGFYPYLGAAWLTATVSVAWALAKALAFTFSRSVYNPQIALIVVSGFFGFMHLAAAYHSIWWHRKRRALGLDGCGYPWEEGEDAWVLWGRTTTPGIADAPLGAGDQRPEQLADADSQFFDCRGITVHVKVARPHCVPGAPATARTDRAVMLLHGFGGGVFSWRHVMQPLADSTGLPVVAFDRPGFGLTERVVPGGVKHDPASGKVRACAPSGSDETPYDVHEQARIALDLCAQLNIAEVILAGHADGAALALVTTAAAAPSPPGSGATGRSGRDSPRCSAAASPHAPAPSSSLAAAAWARIAAVVRSPAGYKRLSGSNTPGGSFPAPHTVFSPRAKPADGPRSFFRPVASWGRKRAPHAPESYSADLESDLEAGIGRAVAIATGSAPKHRRAASAAAAGPQAELSLRLRGSGSQSPNAASSAAGTALSPRSSTERDNLLRLARPGTLKRRPFNRVDDDASSAGSAENAVATGSHKARTSGAWGRAGGANGARAASGASTRVIGIALLHPCLMGEGVPSLAGSLAQAGVSWRILRPLLRAEVGEAANRRAWYDASRLTEDVLAQYRAPLHVEGWEMALTEVLRRAGGGLLLDEVLACLTAVRASAVPALVVSGDQDRICQPCRTGSLVRHGLPACSAVCLEQCGHLSHEERPEELLSALGGLAAWCQGQP
ncbi:unnamed protein product [Pedinophyceae sp. YPF-701]|nr:unnamed protein product [Pedinophyceae sp. YPF-701]